MDASFSTWTSSTQWKAEHFLVANTPFQLELSTGRTLGVAFESLRLFRRAVAWSQQELLPVPAEQ